MEEYKNGVTDQEWEKREKMMDKNPASWRKLVEWDDDKKCYIYRGEQILPLSWEEKNRMPIYMQHQYYWEEIQWIDDRLDADYGDGSNDAQEGLDLFFAYVNGEIE